MLLLVLLDSGGYIGCMHATKMAGGGGGGKILGVNTGKETLHEH